MLFEKESWYRSRSFAVHILSRIPLLMQSLMLFQPIIVLGIRDSSTLVFLQLRISTSSISSQARLTPTTTSLLSKPPLRCVPFPPPQALPCAPGPDTPSLAAAPPPNHPVSPASQLPTSPNEEQQPRKQNHQEPAHSRVPLAAARLTIPDMTPTRSPASRAMHQGAPRSQIVFFRTSWLVRWVC